jgi:hypothetical protein
MPPPLAAGLLVAGLVLTAFGAVSVYELLTQGS